MIYNGKNNETFKQKKWNRGKKTQSKIKKPGVEHCSEKKAGDAEKRNPCQW